MLNRWYLSYNLFQIQIGYRELEHGRKGHPEEVREVRKGDPFDAGVDCEERPDEGGEDEENINRRQKIILQAKLKRGEGEVENQVERERKRYEPRQFSGECFVKHRAVSYRDNGI